MSKFIKLTRILLKSGSGTYASSKKKSLAFIVLIIAALSPTVAMLCKGVSFVYDALKAVNLQGIILGVITGIDCSIIFFFGIFYIINAFYFSKDTENLLPLPLKPSQILGAKFSVVLAYEYLIQLGILLPFLVTYGYKDGANLIYYLYAIVVFLLLPVIPLCLAAFINMVIMRFSGVPKNKDRFRIFAGIIGIVMALGINVVIQRLATVNSDPQKLQQMLMQGDSSSIQTAAKIFPSAKLASLSLTNYANLKGFYFILIFTAVTAAFIGLFLILGEILYLKGVVGSSEVTSSRKGLNSIELEKSSVQSSALRTYTLKELRTLLRTPAFFLNCVLVNFIWPIFLIIPGIADNNTMKQLERLKGLINNGDNGAVLAGAFGFILFITVTNSIASTAISREGQALFVNKYIPMSYSKQLTAKAFAAILLSFAGVVVIVIFAYIVIKPPVILVVIILIASIFAIVFGTFTGLIIDLNFPKLNWDNEQKAVKQNLNVIVNMVLNLVVAGAIIFFTVRFGLGTWAVLGIIILTFGIADSVLYYVLNTTGVELYKNIE